MGICASVPSTKNPEPFFLTNGPSSTIRVINSVDGNLQEFQQPINAGHVLSDHPDTFFLCSSENMFINAHVPRVPHNEDLEPGQIYFIVPVSMSTNRLTLHELCVLTLQASTALKKAAEMRAMGNTVSFSGRRRIKRNGRRSNKVKNVQLDMEELE